MAAGMGMDAGTGIGAGGDDASAGADAAARPALIDRDYLAELLAEDLGGLAGALEDAAREDGDRGFGALERAAASRDAGAAEAAAHAMKGAGGSLGLVRFAAAAEATMLAAGQGEPPSPASVAALRALWNESLAAYRHFFRAGPA